MVATLNHVPLLALITVQVNLLVIMQHFLQNGELLAISPGGVREALFSDEYYTMIWNGRRGFAKVALEAQVVSDCILRNCSRNLLFVNLQKI